MGFCVKAFGEKNQMVATTKKLEGEAFDDFRAICKGAGGKYNSESYGWVIPNEKVPKVRRLLQAAGLEEIQVKPRRTPKNDLEVWAAGALLEVSEFSEEAGDIGPKLQAALTRRGGELSERQWAACVAIALKHKGQASESPPARDFAREPKGSFATGASLPLIATALVGVALTVAGLLA